MRHMKSITRLAKNLGATVFNSVVLPATELFVVLLLVAGFAVGSSAMAQADETELLAMSADIVDEYKALRAECAVQEDNDTKRICFYRLRIKAWDYKQARHYLSLHEKPLQATDMAEVYAAKR